MHGWMDAWMDGWMDGCTDGCEDLTRTGSHTHKTSATICIAVHTKIQHVAALRDQNAKTQQIAQ